MEQVQENKISKKTFYWIGGVVLAIIVVIAIASFTKKDYVASINGEKITKDELYEILLTKYGANELEKIISDKVIEMEINKQKIEVTQDELDDEMKNYYNYYGGEESFKSLLAGSGTELADFEKDVKLYLGSLKLMEKDMEITEEDMKSYFEENKESFNQAEQVEASHILVDNEETAREIISKLKAGEDFAELAKEYSTDDTAKDGGYLGYFGTGKMVEPFEKAAFALKVGTYTEEPVKTEFGYHIIKVTDHKEAKEAVYEDVKDEIKKILVQKEAYNNYSSWLEGLLGKYDIVNYLEKK